MNKIGLISGDGNLPINIGTILKANNFDVTYLLLQSIKNKEIYKNEKYFIIDIISIKKIINILKKKGIRTSLFIEPNTSDVLKSKKFGADCVELHTGKYCNLFKNKKKAKNELSKIKKSAFFAKKIGIDAHAGHGLTYKSTYPISKIKYISEFNIGHFIIAESVFLGLKKTIKKFKKIISK